MKFSSDELIPFSEARSGMSKVIEKVLAGREFVVTRHSKMTVAIITASQLFQFREMERELSESQNKQILRLTETTWRTTRQSPKAIKHKS